MDREDEAAEFEAAERTDNNSASFSTSSPVDAVDGRTGGRADEDDEDKEEDEAEAEVVEGEGESAEEEEGASLSEIG